MDFIHDIYEKNIQDHIHRKFVKYGLGEFEREVLYLKTGNNVHIQAGIDYLDILFFLLGRYAEEDVSITGDLVTNEDIKDNLSSFGITPVSSKAKKYTLRETFTPSRFRDFLKQFSCYYMLFYAKSEKNSITVKKSLPQKGSLIEKFVSAKFDKKFLKDIKDDFLFDWQRDFKQAELHHMYVIKELIVDPELLKRDAAQARLEAQRKGKILRRKIIDGQESVTHIEMLV
jgi:hypothetical protein